MIIFDLAVKNKQTSMEERIARAKKTLDKMHIPQVILVHLHILID